MDRSSPSYRMRIILVVHHSLDFIQRLKDRYMYSTPKFKKSTRECQNITRTHVSSTIDKSYPIYIYIYIYIYR